MRPKFERDGLKRLLNIHAIILMNRQKNRYKCMKNSRNQKVRFEKFELNICGSIRGKVFRRNDETRQEGERGSKESLKMGTTLWTAPYIFCIIMVWYAKREI